MATSYSRFLARYERPAGLLVAIVMGLRHAVAAPGAIVRRAALSRHRHGHDIERRAVGKMQEALAILQAFGRDIGLSADIAHLIAIVRQYERLTGELSGVGVVLRWMESAVRDVLVLSTAFSDLSQTAVALHQDAIRLQSYVGRLRALGFFPTNPISRHEPPTDVGRD
jgi:hypothetical protein